MIEMIQVSKSYDTCPQALLDIDLKVEKGKFLYLMGGSGAGKTTLLKLLYAAERPSAGEIRVDGFDLVRLKRREIPRLRRRLGVVFQDFKLLGRKTVLENVAFALEVLGMEKKGIAKKVSHALEMVGLGEKGHCLPSQLSVGEQQRVAIARGIVNDPQLLLADEPTGNIDLRAAEGLLRLFDEINLRGTTVILATHQEVLPTILPKERVHLEQGRIVERTPLKPYSFIQGVG